MDAREALARAMREEAWDTLLSHILPPAWERDTDSQRSFWLVRADFVLAEMQKDGFVIARADARKGEEG